MSWLHTTVVVFHLLIAAAIVGLVLMQRGKGAEAGAGFGAGASGTVFGARGSASFLSRTTATLAMLFIVTSLLLAYMGGQKPEAPKSVLDRVQAPEASTPAPAADQGGIDAPPALPEVNSAAEPVEQSSTPPGETQQQP
jgi:preprotein translocase subunit SecG